MALKLFNTLTRRKEVFRPLAAPRVNIYACGPTPYAEAHIGNLRTYVSNDILRRALNYCGYQVRQVMNITDVDDKTIRASREGNVALADYTKKYEDLFFADLDKLNIKRSDLIPRATDYIERIIALIELLLAKEAAYLASDGVYFRVSKLKKYGQLHILPPAEASASEQDFVLWKFWKEEDGPVAWEAPFGRGRPGWHIECSAMIEATLGNTIDIHTGGTDLIFPHHENEIAQSETAHGGAPLARYWFHAGFLNVPAATGEEKMSKSLGNIITLKNLMEKDFTPLTYRYLLLTAHYRTTVNFTWEALTAAQIAYRKLRENYLGWGGTTEQINADYRKKFSEFINDDLNVPAALALAWQLVKDEKISPADKCATILVFDEIFGLGLAGLEAESIPDDIQQLVDQRESARRAQDWSKADELRQQIAAAGFSVEDTEKGPRVKVRDAK